MPKRNKIGGCGSKGRRFKTTLSAGQGNKCPCCGIKMVPRSCISVDHMLPLGMGGKNSVYNAAAMHPSCNHRRGFIIEHIVKDGAAYGDIVWWMFGDSLIDDVY